jgi:hypothetical protein
VRSGDLGAGLAARRQWGLPPGSGGEVETKSVLIGVRGLTVEESGVEWRHLGLPEGSKGSKWSELP